MTKRCQWASHESMHIYHDKEWGVPVHDDKTLFEFLTLEGAQAGLNWAIILKKRNGYKKAFANWNIKKIAKFTQEDQTKLLQNPDIVRNRLKISSTIDNAKAFLKIQKEFGSFDKYIWSFVNGKPIKNKFRSLSALPAKTLLSDKISKDLKKRGFRFVGSTIIYAFMQAIGMVNDHEVSCFRYKEV